MGHYLALLKEDSEKEKSPHFKRQLGQKLYSFKLQLIKLAFVWTRTFRP